MADTTLLEIVTLCRDIDILANQAYTGLAETSEGELEVFWRSMAEEEAEHIGFWGRVIGLVELGFVPQVFDAPHSTIRELRELKQRAEEMVQSVGDKLDLRRAFLTAYRMEFYLLHPAFEVLFHYMRTVSNEANPEEAYTSHIARFIEAFRAHAEESEEMALVGETLSRLWSENRRLSRMAMADDLTGILNRRGFMRAIKPMLHLLQRNSLTAGVIMIDVDDFKVINDSHGHLEGDAVLRAVAQRLQGAIRAADIVARYGGEEFIIFFSVPIPPAAEVLGEKVCAAVSHELVEGYEITVSVGVACSRPGREVDEDLADLIADADAALLQAKAGGKNRVVVSE